MPEKKKLGRPRSRRIRRQFHLLPEIDQLIKQQADLLGLTKGQYIEKLVRNQ